MQLGDAEVVDKIEVPGVAVREGSRLVQVSDNAARGRGWGAL